MDSGRFEVLDKVSTEQIFRQWAEEEPFDDYAEPMEGWSVKDCKVFGNDVAIILFENLTGEKPPYYRWYFYKVTENKELELFGKQRTVPKGSCIDAFSYDGELIYACETELTSGKHGVYSLDDGEHAPQDVNNFYDIKFLKISENYFLINSESCIYLAAFPDSAYVVVSDNIYGKVNEWTEEENADKNRSDGKSIIEKLNAEWEDEDMWDSEGDDDDDDDGEDDETDENDKDDEKEALAVVKKIPETEKTGLEELNSLVGLENVKAQINKIVAFAKMQKTMSANGGAELGRINMNMVFSGAPGTAKTTVARLTAKIMKENGILSKGGLVETGRAELIARYVGQTAPKVKKVFEQAKGNLLFIDEAYSLVDGNDGEYGDEAIATIVQEMENNRDDLVVIFAGYEDKMEEFIRKNPGLRSRIPFVIKFEDYSPEELLEISKLEAKRKGFSIDPEAEEKIFGICDEARKNEEFGNGRFSRNLVENAILSYAVRVYGGTDTSHEDEHCVLKAEDFELPENMKIQKKTFKIGFAA